MFRHWFNKEFACLLLSKQTVFDALEGTKEDCPLGEQFCWHPDLPDTAPPRRHATRPDPPVVCPDFGLDRFPNLRMEYDPQVLGISKIRTRGAGLMRW